MKYPLLKANIMDMTSHDTNPVKSNSPDQGLLFRKVLEAVRIPIIIISRQTGHIRFVNGKAGELIHQAGDKVIGRKCRDVLNQDCGENHFLKDSSVPFEQREIRLKLPSDITIEVIMTASAADYQEESCLLITMVDISERKTFEDRMSQLINLESRMLEHLPLSEKHSRITEFLMGLKSSVYCCIWIKGENRHPQVELRKTAEAGVLPYKYPIRDVLSLEEKILDRVVNGTLKQFSKDYCHYGRWLVNNDNKNIGLFMLITKDPLENSDSFFLESVVNLTSGIIMNDDMSRKLEEALARAEKTVALMEGQEIRLKQVQEKADLLAKRYGLKNPMEDPAGYGIHFESELARERVLAIAEEAETARKALYESNEQLSLIKQAIDSSSDAVAISTTTGEFFYINKTFSDFFGYNIAMLAMLSLESLMCEPEEFQSALSSVAAGDPCQKELKMINNTDQSIDIFLRCSTFEDENHTILGLIWSFTDITHSKENERKIQTYTKKIERDLSEKKNMLDKAALLQESLINKTLPLDKTISIHGMFMPCETLGGDFFRIQKGLYENKLVIVMGDCTGHGVESSMDASLLTRLVDRNLSLVYDTQTDLFLKTISRAYMQISDEDQFPTMFAMVMDLEKGILYYSNANSEIPFLIRNGKIGQLESAEGMHIGYFDDPHYERKEFKLEKGDKLLLFSDAVVEIEKKQDKRLGYDGLISLVEDTLCREKGEFGDLLNYIYAENGKFPLMDDMTLVLLEHTGQEAFSFNISTLEQWRSEMETLRSKIFRHRFNYDETEQFLIALDEMCINAVHHGNKDDPAKNVHIEGVVNSLFITAVIEDEGPGFDPSAVPDPVFHLEEILDRGVEEEFVHGRGIKLTGTLVDEISYNDKGNCVFLKKNKSDRLLLDYKKWLEEV